MLIVISFVFLGFRLFMIQRDNGRIYTRQVLSQQGYDNKALPFRRGLSLIPKEQSWLTVSLSIT